MEIKVNDKFEVKCIDLNHEGFGVAKVDGFSIFVEGLLIGEVANVKIIKKEKNFARAEIVDYIEKSKDRVEPICPAFKNCGGCDLMHLSYEKQLEFKKKMVYETIKRIGHVDKEVKEIIGMEEPYYYRNKVQIPFSNFKEKTICGFFQKKTHYITKLDKCFIQPQETTDIANFIKELANNNGILGYNEKDKTGIIRHVLIRKTVNDDYMVVIITKTKQIPNLYILISEILKKFPNVKSIIQNINTADSNVILGHKEIVLYGSKELVDEINNMKFRISSKTFFQTNHIQTEKLYNKAIEYADPKKDDIIVDAYCGVGTIGIIMANKVKKVYGIEVVEDSINDATENAKLNNIDNVEFILGKVEEKIIEIDSKINTIVVDPPRKGCERTLLNTIIDKKINKIVYVSCDVATLARDIEILSTNYDLKEITAVDMFPHTSNVECVVLLELKK